MPDLPLTIPIRHDSTRVFCGSKLPSQTRETFFKELGNTFMPGTPQMLAPLGLNAYVPAVLDLDPALGLPDEVALIVYASRPWYAAARERNISGRMYTHSHAGVFDMTKSRGQWPGSAASPDKLMPDDRWSWFLYDVAVDWQSGSTRVVALKGGGSPMQQLLLDATRGATGTLSAAGADQAIAVAAPNYGVVWLHSPQPMTADVADLGLVPRGAQVVRDLVARPVPMPTLTETLEITEAAAFTFRFERELRFYL